MKVDISTKVRDVLETKRTSLELAESQTGYGVESGQRQVGVDCQTCRS